MHVGHLVQAEGQGKRCWPPPPFIYLAKGSTRSANKPYTLFTTLQAHGSVVSFSGHSEFVTHQTCTTASPFVAAL
jgi:hypothetical protein